MRVRLAQDYNDFNVEVPLSRTARSLALIILAALAPFPCWAQRLPGGDTATHDVVGAVRDDAGGRPIAGARAQLFTESGMAVSAVGFSSSNGEFRLRDLHPGDYVLVVEQSGYEAARLPVKVTGVGDTRVTVLMHRTESATVPAAAGTTTAHQLAIPEKARKLFEKGMELSHGKSDMRAGIAQFQRAIEICPDYYEAYAQLGVAYDRAGDTASAEAALRKSVEMSEGKFTEPMFLLAELLNEHEQFAEAAEIAQRAITVEAGSWRGHYQLARAFAGLKRNAEAEASANKARELKPDGPDIYLLLSNLHMRSRDYPSLVKDLDAYLKLAPNAPSSEQARRVRDQVKQALEQTKKPAATSPKP